MSYTVNTNFVNDTDGYLLDTKNVKAGTSGGTMVMLDEVLEDVEGAVSDLQDRVDALEEPTEVSIYDTGAVTQALEAGTVYHFLGTLTRLTITLSETQGMPHYHFDFLSGSGPAQLVLPADVKMPDGFSVETGKRYEVDILNGWGVAAEWSSS